MNEGTTHYAGCIQAGPKHYECALLEIGRLRGTIMDLRVKLEAADNRNTAMMKMGDRLIAEREGKHYTAKDKYSAAPEERYNESGQLIELHPKWVGLTGAETNHIVAKNVGYPERMMKDVENLLKEKNDEQG